MLQAGREDGLTIAESHGLSLPKLSTFPHLRLLIIVWEASLGTPLPAYVANFTQQLERSSRRRSSGQDPRSGAEVLSANVATGEATDDGVVCCVTNSDELNDSLVQAQFLSAASPAASAKFAGGRSELEQQQTTQSISRGQTQCMSAPAPQVGLMGGSPAPSHQAPRRVDARQPPLRVLVVCNKTDSMPCPMPQIRGLKPEQAFIAVSALRGTNLGHLWTMVSPLLPHARGDAAPSSIARDALSTDPSSVTSSDANTSGRIRGRQGQHRH